MMGNKNNMNFTNWNPGCDHGCAEPASCGCEAAAACGCENNNVYTGCACNAAAPVSTACGCTQTANTGLRPECANETHIIYETCDGYKEITVTGACQQEAAPGRVLDVNMTLLNVCPGRRGALGLTLVELDGSGTEYARGFQAVAVPAHHGRCNQDMTLDTIRFIIPEEQCSQQRRHFIVRAQHHYLDAGSIWNNTCGR